MRKIGGDGAIKAIRPAVCLPRPTPHLLNQERLEPQTVFLTEQLDLDRRAITATTAILACCGFGAGVPRRDGGDDHLARA
jgi:hypothetical protein